MAPRLFSHLLHAALLHSEVDSEGRVRLVPGCPQLKGLSAVQEGWLETSWVREGFLRERSMRMRPQTCVRSTGEGKGCLSVSSSVYCMSTESPMHFQNLERVSLARALDESRRWLHIGQARFQKVFMKQDVRDVYLSRVTWIMEHMV